MSRSAGGHQRALFPHTAAFAALICSRLLTAHGLAGVELLAQQELLQLPDVHPGLGHGGRVPALGRTTVLGRSVSWKDRKKDR